MSSRCEIIIKATDRDGLEEVVVTSFGVHREAGVRFLGRLVPALEALERATVDIKASSTKGKGHA